MGGSSSDDAEAGPARRSPPHASARGAPGSLADGSTLDTVHDLSTDYGHGRPTSSSGVRLRVGDDSNAHEERPKSPLERGDGPSDGTFYTPSEYPEKADGILKRFLRFYFHDGIPSFTLRMTVWAAILVTIGSIVHYCTRALSAPALPFGKLTIAAGAVLFVFAAILLTLHAVIVFCHQIRLFYKWSFIHYVSELELYAAVIITALLVILGLVWPPTKAAFADVIGKQIATETVAKAAFGASLTAVIFAIKRHYITGLAMSFNYTNYKDRIQESLFGDRVLSMLQKSRHTYKLRQKWRSTMQQRLPQDSTLSSPTRGTSPWNALFATNSGLLHTNSETVVSESGRPASVRCAMDLFPPSPTRSLAARPGCGAAFPPKDWRAAALIGGQGGPFGTTKDGAQAAGNSQGRTQQPSIAAYITESDKKRQFVEFSRLAGKMIARFSNTSDYRIDIRNEAHRMAQKLYKYLVPTDRDYLTGVDFMPYIEDEEEYRHAVALLKRHAEGANLLVTLSMDDASREPFSRGDLIRCIDGILTELYVIAKSLQTIESAIEQVDFLLTVILSLFVAVVVMAVFMSAANVLGALSTLIGGLAFAFTTSAKNMLESIVFLLVVHPFDIGDRVFIPLNTTSQDMASTVATMSDVDALDNLVVVEMHVLSTVFERWDGVKMYVPNYVLSEKPIFNVRRSGPLTETQRLEVDFSTPIAKIDELRRRLGDFVCREQSDFTTMSRVNIDSMEKCNMIRINILFQHMTNWQDIDTRLARRTKMVTFLKETAADLELSYVPPLQRVAIVSGGSLGADKATNLLTPGEVSRIAGLSARVTR